MDSSDEEVTSRMKKFPVSTQDGVRFDVDAEVAMEMKTFQSLIDQDDWINGPSVIPLPQVSSDSFKKIIDYFNKHRILKIKAKLFGDFHESISGCEKYGEVFAEETRTYQKNFLHNYDFDAIKKLILAVKYLKVEELGDFLIQATRDQIQNKSLEELRKFFGIKKKAENRAKKSRPSDRFRKIQLG